MKNLRFYFFWVLIFFQSITFSQTNVNGNVSGVWTITNSPYIVTNNLVLQPTDTLIINPGVEVRFDGTYRFDIFGTFFAIGTASDSIIFTRNASTNWGSLNFADASNDSSKIQYCIIEYGSSSVYDPYHGVINCFESSPMIANSAIRNNSQKSIYALGSNAQPLILINAFKNNSGGVFVKSGAQPIIDGNELISNYGTGIYIDFSPNIVINDNNISNNTGRGIFLSRYCDSAIITNNIITANTSGICLSERNDYVSIKNNVVSNNNEAGILIGSYNEGVIVDSNNISNNGTYGSMDGIELYQYNDHVTISNNTIHGNGDYGVSLYMYNDQVNVENNIISNNSTAGIHLYRSNIGTDIENNTFTSNGTYGIIVEYVGNGGINIFNNTISNHSNYGIGIPFGSDNPGYIIKNLIVDNGGYGIYLNNIGNSIQIINNTIKGHDTYGLYYDTNAPDNIHNRFSVINNSITNNSIGIYLNRGGEHNTIAYNNSWNNITNDYAGSLPSGTGNLTIININSTICDVYYNISENPLYTDTNNNDFTLQPGSPNISAGDPGYTDPDGTISDIGAFYFDTPHYTPEADFIGDILSGNPLLTVNFTDLSQVSDVGTPVNSWSWDFGDDSISTEQNPTHTYQQSGNYTVTLEITDLIGFRDTEIKENYINIFATEVHDLDIGGDEDLQHLISHEPIITFDFYNSENELQTHYQVQITTDSTLTSIDMWDSGEVTSSDTSIIYAGNDLMDGQTYYLRVKVSSSGFWSEWATLTFRMNTEPSTPVQVSPINEVSGVPVVLKVLNSTDVESDGITYSFNVYSDANRIIKLDSVMAVIEGIDTTGWQVTATLPDNGQYWWTVSANDGYEESAVSGPASFLLNTTNDGPAAFTLLSPAGSSEVDTLNPLLVWESAFDPDPLDTVRYTLYLDTPEPGVEVISVDTTTSYQIITSLLDNTTYYWKVVATDLSRANTENTGGYRSFRVNTENDPPSPFNLITPTEFSVEIDLTPIFIWENNGDLDGDALIYNLHYSMDSLLAGTTTIEIDSNEFIPVDSLLDNATYFWKVIAEDQGGLQYTTDTWLFWTNTILEPPNPFDLVSPPNGDQNLPTTPEFVWSTATDNDPNDYAVYNLLISQDSTFTEVDICIEGLSDTSFSLSENLSDNNQYYWRVDAIDTDSLVTTSEIFSLVVGTLAISDNLQGIPTKYSLSQNYPNPFNPTTTIQYELPLRSDVQITIYDLLGRKLTTLISETQDAGYKSVKWDATNDQGQPVSAGIYFYQIRAGKFLLTKKMVLLR